jgi:hypothetical protein
MSFIVAMIWATDNRDTILMLKRVNWYVLLGVFFLLVGVLYVAVGRWVDAAWSLVLGVGNLLIAYAQKHPALGQGRVAWAVAIVFVVVLVALTILKLRTP